MARWDDEPYSRYLYEIPNFLLYVVLVFWQKAQGWASGVEWTGVWEGHYDEFVFVIYHGYFDQLGECICSFWIKIHSNVIDACRFEWGSFSKCFVLSRESFFPPLNLSCRRGPTGHRVVLDISEYHIWYGKPCMSCSFIEGRAYIFTMLRFPFIIQCSMCSRIARSVMSLWMHSRLCYATKLFARHIFTDYASFSSRQPQGSAKCL